MRVKFGSGTKDVPLLDAATGNYNVTPENYIVPEDEQGSYHVIQEIKDFDRRTGKRLSRPRLQKYGAKEFPAIQRILKQQGYDITVLYNPAKYLQAQAEAEEERKNLTSQKERELEQKKYEAEKAKMKAEILAELKEAGIIPQKTEGSKTGSGSKKTK